MRAFRVFLAAMLLMVAVALPSSAYGFSRDLRAPPSYQVTFSGAEFMSDMPAPDPPARATVCVIDTGLTLNHTLAGAAVTMTTISGTDTSDNSIRAYGLHGTSVIQTIAGIGVRRYGVFPFARVLSVKANIDDVDHFSTRNVLDALMICRSDPTLAVVNMSFGTAREEPAPELTAKIRDLISRDVSVVASAGLEDALSRLAAIPGVISVGAVDSGGRDCSTTKAPTMIVAFGCHVEIEPVGYDGTHTVNGTSMAAPQVAATIAALRAYLPSLTARDAERITVESATPLPSGRRQLNMRAAFERAGIPLPVPDPELSFTEPAQNAPSRVQRRPPVPRVKVAVLARRLRVTFLNRPKGSIAVFQRGSRTVRRAARRTVTFPVRRWKQTRVFYRVRRTRGSAAIIAAVRQARTPRPRREFRADPVAEELFGLSAVSRR